MKYEKPVVERHLLNAHMLQTKISACLAAGGVWDDSDGCIRVT